jgi:NADPH-dependent 2,4-dienoyl-CoA reductase/sulfur reductase-like enzyme
MSGAEFTENGYDIEEGVEIAKLIAPKVDLLHVSAGVHDNPDTFTITHPSMFQDHGCNVFLAERIKKAVDVPVATVGGLSDPAMMEEILASGKADVVEMSRSLIADPFLPEKAKLGKDEEIVRCMRCFVCMNQMQTTRNPKCALNPVIGRELEHMHPFPPAQPKRVLVAGGGPGGMQAAIAAAERGHSVILCEATGALGGQLNYEKHVPFKQDLYDFGQQLIRRLERSGAEVRLHTRVTPELAEQIAPDAIVAAVGADYIVPDIPGIGGDNVKFLPALLEEEPGFGKRVVILGGGLVGCETAVHLMRQGRDVTVLEMCADFAPDAPLYHKQALGIQFRRGVSLKLNTKAVAVTPEGVLCAGPEGKEHLIPADTVFCAVGLRCREAAREALRNCAPAFFPVGDCVAPGQVTQAVAGGYYAALDI